ncbi:MAG: hypothetical protein AAFQ05_12330 [Pseudomonadota bacterium]
MRQLVIYAGLALIVTLALAVSLLNRRAPEADQRSTQVISEFINLSAAPDPRGMDFLSRTRIQRTNRLERLAHIEPRVITAFAQAQDTSEDNLRLQIADPDQSNAFDHTGVVFDPPQSFAKGQAGGWTWTLVTERAETRASQAEGSAGCGQTRSCRAWVLYWDDTAWYYAPVATPAHSASLKDAMPELADAMAEILAERQTVEPLPLGETK